MARIRIGCFHRLKAVAAVLMAIGAVVLVCNLPGWVWGTVVGIVLISAGFLLWRFL